ncbi:SDR family NAD(P)-dependent oxidoreductase [Synechococcus sp. MIT S9451]|uniref:SDR family NAD(P)-dependent oxidoreductase n=1 Tax=Synechococcus sp. MIT S9451 TaxID=3082543 RepID=UPI0039B4E933
MDLRISGKTALVTGGASGIGLAIVKELLDNDCNVYFTSRSSERLEHASQQLKPISSKYFPLKIDLCEDGVPEQLAKDLLSKTSIDILVNNIGDTLGITDPYCPIEDWHRLFDLIMGVAIRLNNAFIPNMSSNHWGRIVNITAGAAYENSGPVPYCTFKAAFTAYSRSMARVLALESNNVVMSSVLPGVVITENGHWQNVMKTRPEHAEKYLSERTTLKRFGLPEEISPIVALLCSDLASFCVGSVIPVEGGQARHYFQRVED